MISRQQRKWAVGIAIAVVLILVGALLSGNHFNSALTPEEVAGNLSADKAGAGGYARQSGQSDAAVPAAGTVVDGEFASTGGDTDNLQQQQEQQQPQQDQSGDQRVILKTAYLSLVVDNPVSSITTISNMAQALGGWVVNSSTNAVTTPAGQSVAQGSITIRVPAAKLDDAMTQIKSGAGSVTSENVTGQDVTQQYVDLQSQLTNLQAAETQLREIMANATKTEDVLAVYNQLVSTRGQIESIQGQIKYFDQSSAYSSISVDLTPTAVETPIQIAGWSPARSVQEAAAVLIGVLQFLADAVINIAIVGLPLVILFGIPGWLIWRRVRRKPAVVLTAQA